MGTASEPFRDIWVDTGMSSGKDHHQAQRDTSEAMEEDDGFTELIHSMSRILPEGELSNKALWKLGYVPPLHLRLPWFSYGVQPPDESPRTSMDSAGSPGRTDTRPIPASYYRTSPAASPTASPATSPATSRASSLELLDYPLDVQTIESSRFASSRIESFKQPRSEYKSSLPEAACRRQRLVLELGPVSSQRIAANNMAALKRRQPAEPSTARYSCGLLAAGVRRRRDETSPHFLSRQIST